MHLLEATLAWAATTDDPAWGAIADDITELALAKYIDARGGLPTGTAIGGPPSRHLRRPGCPPLTSLASD